MCKEWHLSPTGKQWAEFNDARSHHSSALRDVKYAGDERGIPIWSKSRSQVTEVCKCRSYAGNHVKPTLEVRAQVSQVIIKQRVKVHMSEIHKKAISKM